MLQIRILGPLEAAEDDRALLLGGPKQRALLAALVLARGEALSSERLVDTLWGDRASATAATTVRVYVSNLRKVLGSGVLVTRAHGYLLEPSAVEVDADRFTALVSEARTALADGDAAGARESLAAALGLWRGEPLQDLVYESFVAPEIARLREEHVAALEARVDADLLLGRHAGLVGELEALVREYPHREHLLAQYMLALYRTGRHADALEAYRRGRRALDDELGLEPGRELRELERQILSHDVALDAPRRPAPATENGRAWARVLSARSLVVIGAVLLVATSIAAVIARHSAGTTTTVRVLPNSVAVIDAHSDRVVAAIAVGARPDAIVAGAGALWVANHDDESLSRVDQASLQTLRTIALPDPPTALGFSGGAVWVSTANPSGAFVSLVRVDAQFDTIDRTVRLGNVVPGTPAPLAAHNGSLWVAPFSGNLAALDPDSGRIIQQIDPNGAPTGIDFDAHGVWITDASAGNVIRIDPTGLVTTVPVGNGPSGLAVGYGSVWVADTGDNKVVRIDPQTRAVTTTIPVGQGPTAIALGAGSVWVANSSDGTVSRIDPVSARVRATIAVGGSPQALTVAGGRVWVTVAARLLPEPVGNVSSTLRILAQSDVNSMDPALAYDALSFQLLYLTCAKLLNFPDTGGPASAQIIPEVAQALPTRSADGRTYTFTIRPGFEFSPPSNQPVTALTFKTTIERTLNPRMHSPIASQFQDIVGADAYTSGHAQHISGITALGDTLTIHLTAPAPDLLARLTEPAFCAVPSDTPIVPSGVAVIPSAGPYRVSAYSPGQGIVLTRNPNYRGSRPRHFARIEVTVGVPLQRAVAQVEAGNADYTGGVPTNDAASLVMRFGPRSPAARSGHQQYFVNPLPQLDALAFNTHRPLFAHLRLRQAVNYAISRTALAQLGDEYVPLPAQVTDHYLPPGIPGHTDVHIYPALPDLARARTLVGHLAGSVATLYTCDISPCDQQAQIIKTDLAAVGIQVAVRTYPDQILYRRIANPGEPFDFAWIGWVADYPDPDAILNELLESGSVIPTFNDPAYRGPLASAAELTGPNRYLTYARLDAQLARNAAPMAAIDNISSIDFFARRIGCQAFGQYGMDLAALCLKPG